jgi:hypothetical protein
MPVYVWNDAEKEEPLFIVAAPTADEARQLINFHYILDEYEDAIVSDDPWQIDDDTFCILYGR